MSAEVVTAKTDRERQLADFAAGRIRVLINMLILTEGFDCPSLKTVFCRPSGRGCTIQMGGRVFRKHPDLPRKQIVQCKATRHPFIRTAMADEQYVWADGQWRALTVNRADHRHQRSDTPDDRPHASQLAKAGGCAPPAADALARRRDRFRSSLRKRERKT